MNILAVGRVTDRSGARDEVDNVGRETLNLAAHVPAVGCMIPFPMFSKVHACRAALDGVRDSAIRGDLAVCRCGGWRREAAHDGDRCVGVGASLLNGRTRSVRASRGIVSIWKNGSAPLDGPRCERMVLAGSPSLGVRETASRRRDGAPSSVESVVFAGLDQSIG